MKEEWRIIPGYGNYAINDQKKVKNLKSGKKVGHANRTTSGSRDVALLKSDTGQYKMFTIERLFGMCFGYQPPVEPGEEWRRVDGFPGIAVSNMGRVWSDWFCDILHGCPGGKGGYLTVTITGRSYRIHRLVAAAFIYGCDLKPWYIVRHLDGNSANNCLENLDIKY